jgi:hypothetical protein
MAYNKKSSGAGLAIGAGLGTALGVALHDIGVWLPVGVAIGVLFPIWQGKETVASSEDRKERT